MKQAMGLIHGRSILGLRWILALVATVLLFPGTAAPQGAGGEDALFEATVYGDISGGPQAREQAIRHNTTMIVISKPSMVLDLTYFQGWTFKEEGDGANCFAQGSYGGPDGGGSMHISKEKDGSALATAWIHGATANNGVSDVVYSLDMVGTFLDPDNWPPLLNTDNTLLITGWEMSSEGKGNLKNISCTGSGDFSTSILVRRLPLPE